MHKAKIIKEKLVEWRQKGLYLQFIPAYSPELNKIEILWSP
ncbi:transposase [Chondrinema litorale]